MLVTGAGGFLGREVCARLSATGRVIGADLPNVEPAPGVEWKIIDTGAALERAIVESRPAVVIHAAFRNHKSNGAAHDNDFAQSISDSERVFDAALTAGSKVLLVSSSAVYGNGNGQETLDETTPARPVSAYGRAKVTVESAAIERARTGLKLCVARPFNLVGPIEQPGMILSDWVRQVVALESGATDAIYVRHRRSARDFVDVRDAARALCMLASEFKPGEIFNIASGKAVPLMDISRELEVLAGHELPFVETGTLASDDVVSQRGSNAKLGEATGWKAAIPWRKSLADLWQTMVLRSHLLKPSSRHGL